MSFTKILGVTAVPLLLSLCASPTAHPQSGLDESRELKAARAVDALIAALKDRDPWVR